LVNFKHQLDLAFGLPRSVFSPINAFVGNVIDILVAYSRLVLPWLVPLFTLDIHQHIIYGELQVE